MLATALKNARANGVPKDTIEAALSRGARVRTPPSHPIVHTYIEIKDAVPVSFL